jgi:hypothetical protein
LDHVQFLQDVFDVLLQFRDVDIPKICPNQLGNLCERQAVWNGKNIPADLKGIHEALSERNDTGIQARLLDDRFLEKIPDLPEMELQTVCREIDDRIKNIFTSSRQQDPQFREPVTLLRRVWFQRPDVSKLFPFCAKRKSSIVCEMILTDEARELAVEISEHPSDVMRQVLKLHPAVLEYVVAHAPDIAKFPPALLQQIAASDPTELARRTSPDRFATEDAWRAEAQLVVYEHLLGSDQFSPPAWLNRTESPSDYEFADSGGKTVHVRRTWGEVDMEVSTRDGRTFPLCVMGWGSRRFSAPRELSQEEMSRVIIAFVATLRPPVVLLLNAPPSRHSR